LKIVLTLPNNNPSTSKIS